MFELNDKTAIVTGGGSGIGKAICTLFAKQRARVYVLDIDEPGGIQTVKGIISAGGNATFLKCDITSAAQTKETIDRIYKNEQAIDIVVNNAGIAHVGNLEATAATDFDKLLAVNVKGMYHVLSAVIPFMKLKGGVILNMASVASSVGIPDRFAYSMTKGAVLGMSLSVAKDYLSSHIRCNCISPARVHTPFVDGFIEKNYPGNEAAVFEKLSKTQPIGRMAEPHEVAALALYLCSDEASFVTGCDYPFDGGFIKLNN